MVDVAALTALCRSQVEAKTFPGAAFALGKGSETAFGLVGNFTYAPESPVVQADSLFDLASLTKVIATTTAAMLLHDDGLLELDRPVAAFLSDYESGEKRDVAVRNLLLHDSGLPAYANLSKFKTRAEALAAVRGLPLSAKPGEKTVYSCMSMITLMQVVETVLGSSPGVSNSGGSKSGEAAVGSSMSTFLAERLFKPLGMADTLFNPPEDLGPRCVPTLENDPQRKRAIRGEVHDPAAYYCGGLSGNAGLFSTIADVAKFGRLILNKGAHGSRQIICAKTVESWTKRHSERSTRALGWDTNALGGISAGSKLSKSSFGHTGYTGTSIWIDPENGFFVVLLTNRTYPDDKNFAHNGFRPKFHDAAFQMLRS